MGEACFVGEPVGQRGGEAVEGVCVMSTNSAGVRLQPRGPAAPRPRWE